MLLLLLFIVVLPSRYLYLPCERGTRRTIRDILVEVHTTSLDFIGDLLWQKTLRLAFLPGVPLKAGDTIEISLIITKKNSTFSTCRPPCLVLLTSSSDPVSYL
uniref:Putative secreted protein n=1 Tax=Anopheles triannulatus TaxID=58253 RepID=A0A2M4B3X2_9DIPT